jgi:glutathionylspermidine synthase
VDNFVRIKDLNKDLKPHILISTLKNAPEDDHNVSVIMEAAKEAGFEVEFQYVDEVTFSAKAGIFAHYKEDDTYRQFFFWFKLVPWEYIAYEEPELMELLRQIILNREAVVLNPPYTMLFQSKTIMKYLWDLYPQEKTLLETRFEPLKGKGQVKKVILGREGANVSIIDKDGTVLTATEGDYGDYPSIYQEFATLAQDSDEYYYQAGVFFSYEACGLGFRRNKHIIIDNAAQFVGHILENPPA